MLANGIWIIRRGGESTSNRFIADWFANSAMRSGPERSTVPVINGRGCAGVVQKLSAEKTDRTSRYGYDFRSAGPVRIPMNSPTATSSEPLLSR